MRLFQDPLPIRDRHVVSTDIVSLARKEILSRHSRLAGASKNGLTVHSRRRFFVVPEKDFSKFLNQPVELFLSQYELPFYGVIKQISSIGEDLFEIQISFLEDTPLYYRECVEDLLN